MTSVFDTSLFSNLEPCSGCGVCAAACPRHAIVMEMNEQGFFMPALIEDRCVSCGRCTLSCYRFIKVYAETLPRLPDIGQGTIYGAFTKDPLTRHASSSGGIAPELARTFLAQGYRIGGVFYDSKDHVARYTFADTPAALSPLAGSKYLQSFSSDAFSEFAADKERRYLFFGLPCQIYGIRRLAEQNDALDRILLVDLFCMGVPTYLLWQKYLDMLRSSKAVDEVTGPRFRDKRTGWHTFSMTVSGRKKDYSAPKSKDIFFLFYLKKNCVCAACYACPLRREKVASDLRLGDFWGPAYLHDNKGVSLVCIFSSKGLNAWEKIASTINIVKRHGLGDLLAAQPVDRITVPSERQAIMALLADPSISLPDIAKTYLKPPERLPALWQKLKRAFRRAINRLKH